VNDLPSTLTSTAYALFALEQPLALSDIAAGARTSSFPSAEIHTPAWFAAAAEGSDLLATAPELRAMPTDPGAEADVALSAADLIRVYAPQSADQEKEVDADEVAVEVPAPVRTRPPVQINLLRELGGIDD
jgi:hypothetical protein